MSGTALTDERILAASRDCFLCGKRVSLSVAMHFAPLAPAGSLVQPPKGQCHSDCVERHGSVPGRVQAAYQRWVIDAFNHPRSMVPRAAPQERVA